MPAVPDDTSIRSLLEERAAADPDGHYLLWRGEPLTFAALDASVNRLANGFAARGIAAGSRVALMLEDHPDHVQVFFALAKLGAIQIPINTRLRHDPLAYVLSASRPALLLADGHFRDALDEVFAGGTPRPGCLWRGGAAPVGENFAALGRSMPDSAPPGDPGADDVLTVLYTSGTTGPPKGVLVTDRMHRVCARASALASGVVDGDVFYMWEPLHHVGGTQVLVLALEHRVCLALAGRFSVTAFWDECRAAGATRVHFLGGILQMLLSAPATPRDRDHDVRIAWGGGAPPGVWRAFESRFGIEVRENYGMTEACSLTSINDEARFGTVGRPAPWFEVRIVAADGRTLPPGERGEILVRGREPGLLTPGYFENPEATALALRDGWLYTGDLGQIDDAGHLVFLGRLKDCIRRRGENVSAWEVEHAVDAMDGIEESAVVAVPGELDDEEIKLFVKLAADRRPAPEAVFAWCESRLAPFQIPRYLAFVDGFDKTGTQRIRKETLSRALDDGWVRDQAGAVRRATA